MDTPEKEGLTGAALRAAQLQVEDMQRQLASARQVLEEFTYSVSHDLRAPLRHVSAYLKIIREDLPEPVDPAILSHLQTASDAAAQMGRQMDGLLELSRVGRAEMHWGVVDLPSLVAEVQHGLAPQIGERQIHWQIAPDLPPLRGDITLLARLVQGVLSNAVKFTRLTSGAIIRVGWQPARPGWCELQVEDNGAGFDPRFSDRLFKAFQRLHSARQFEGLGMGLALARLVVERHGGQIRAEGSVDGGCRIRLELPMAGAAAA